LPVLGWREMTRRSVTGHFNEIEITHPMRKLSCAIFAQQHNTLF
jgi:hypothetical protein